jgi:hypothetical protein
MKECMVMMHHQSCLDRTAILAEDMPSYEPHRHRNKWLLLVTSLNSSQRLYAVTGYVSVKRP